MEHYDGPAFYRKFAVKPSPEQLEDTTNERAQRSVKQRQERNDRLRLREERTVRREQTVKQDGPAKPRNASVANSTPVSQTAAPKSSDDENYRPFQMTPIPKQLHWAHPTSESRRRYRRLVTELHKDDSSFLLFGLAVDSADVDRASAPDLTASEVSVSDTTAVADTKSDNTDVSTDARDDAMSVSSTLAETTESNDEQANSDSEPVEDESDNLASDSEAVMETSSDHAITSDTEADDHSVADAEITSDDVSANNVADSEADATVTCETAVSYTHLTLPTICSV